MMIRRLTTLAVICLVTGCDKPKAAVPVTDSAATIAADTDAKPVQQSALKAPAAVPSTVEEWERFDYSTTAVPPSALASMSLADVQRIRGIIFGKHGRIFQDSTLQSWLMTRRWYHADMDFTNGRLTEGEKQNLDVVRDAEASKHTYIEPG